MSSIARKLMPESMLNSKHADLKTELVDVKDQKGMTTDYGVPISDPDRWLKVSNGENIGPHLLEDPIAREKIHRFDHERIPERVVHARGAGAFGYFKAFGSDAAKYTSAGVLTDSSRTTPVFVRFSTVQGSRGSAVGHISIPNSLSYCSILAGHRSRRTRFRSQVLH